MKTTTVRDVRNHFAIATVAAGKPRRINKPDIKARVAQTFGGRAYAAEDVSRMRGAELEGE